MAQTPGKPAVASDGSPLLPVRRLSNYAYCPRLFYYQWVEGIFVPNADTVAGSSAHRQVDKPSRIEDWEGLELAAGARLRSFQVENENLGLSGEIDLLEGGADGVWILDYKKGSARRTADGELCAKENDAIQVAAYVLLARGDGIPVCGATVYYAGDRRRVNVELTEGLLTRVRLLTAEARSLAGSGVCPPPLVDDARCLHCSAYPVCLPRESRYWQNPGSVSDPKLETPPPVVEREEGEVLILQDCRSFVGRHGQEIQVSRDHETLAKIPIHQLRSIYVYGAVQISAQLIETCLEEGIDVAYFAASGRFLGLLRGLPASGVDARLGQYRLFQQPGARLLLAREVVRAKIHNQRVLLMRNGEAPPAILDQMRQFRDRAPHAETESILLGIEGEAAALYFSQFATMVKNADFDFTRRNRRPPRDPVNALLSMGYSMLAKELAGVCYAVGLDPFLGFYHHPRYGRPALALDLMEEFRPLVADSLTLSLVNRGELDLQADFLNSSHGCNLNQHGRRAYWQGWFRRLDSEVSHPVFGYRMSYRRMFEVQARQLWRFVRGEAAGYTAFTTR